MKRLALLLGLILLGAQLPALTASTLAAPATVHAPASTFHATMVNTRGHKYAFLPATITVKVGTTVTWKNLSSADHTVTATNGSWSSINVSHGGSYSRRFSKTGTYRYVCGLHVYMTGVVIVKR